MARRDNRPRRLEAHVHFEDGSKCAVDLSRLGEVTHANWRVKAKQALDQLTTSYNMDDGATIVVRINPVTPDEYATNPER